MQQRIDRERNELEQGHVRIVKEYELRVRDLDNSNQVGSLCITWPPNFDIWTFSKLEWLIVSLIFSN